ncbi:MAG: 30S ribosomal protein S8 [SAR202 cluster bacterium]|nr:30S ribosomal protein S8 [SAR202 cluster bacterium]
MPVSDPIGDMLTRVRNAQLVRHSAVEMPSSKARVAVADILKREGFIQDYEVARKRPQGQLRLRLRYTDRREPAISGLRRVSKPGLRVHLQKGEVPRAFGGIGIAIVSTSQGVMTGKEALEKKIGGELWAYVW